MSDIRLSIALTSNPRTWPVLDGRVKPDGATLTPTVLHPSEMFWRQLKFAEFDIAEMSMSSFMMLTAAEDDRFVGLPVFTTRAFFHTGILVRRAAGIDKPEDLKGKRVGIPEYQQTAALWIRGVLQHEFDVAPRDMEFWMERNPDRSHAGATNSQPPRDVRLNYIDPAKSIGSMMESGELDAALFYLRGKNLVDRSTEDLANNPDIKPLFPDAWAERQRYFQSTGLHHINHGMVMRRSLLNDHPWLALNILKAFNQANEIADTERVAQAAYHLETGDLLPDAEEVLRKPLVRHGVKAPRKTLEAAAQYSFEQGLTPRLINLDELFAPSTLDQ